MFSCPLEQKYPPSSPPFAQCILLIISSITSGV